MSRTEHLVAGYFRCSEMSSLLDPVFRALRVTAGSTDKTGQVYTLDIFVNVDILQTPLAGKGKDE